MPAGQRAAAAAAIGRSGEPGSGLARWRLRLVALGLRCGAGEALLRDRYRVRTSGEVPPHPGGEVGTVEQHLRDVLGDVVCSLSIGPLRANRKPVLQVLARDGRTVAFVKVGVDGLTKDLVRQERDALLHLQEARARLSSVRVPEVLSFTTWRGLDILVQSPLPIWERRVRADGARLAAAMREVSEVAGVQRCPLVDSAYWAALLRRVRQLRHAGTRGALAAAAAAALGRSAGTTVLGFGAWHGDWAPWNMAYTQDELLVWDWERFARPAPLGFDNVHHLLQTALMDRSRSPRSAVQATMRSARPHLQEAGVADEESQVVALLYLMELATRYAEDGQADVGARLGVLGDWLLPVLAEEVARV